jgi:hypothetical protein
MITFKLTKGEAMLVGGALELCIKLYEKPEYTQLAEKLADTIARHLMVESGILINETFESNTNKGEK